MHYVLIGLLVLVSMIAYLIWESKRQDKKILDTRDPRDEKIFKNIIDVLRHKQELLVNHDGEYYECEEYAFILTENVFGENEPSVTPHIQLTLPERQELQYALYSYQLDVKIKTEVESRTKNDELKEITANKLKWDK